VVGGLAAQQHLHLRGGADIPEDRHQQRNESGMGKLDLVGGISGQ
jgi:hypothetical protein